MTSNGASLKPCNDKGMKRNVSYSYSGQLPRSMKVRMKEEKRRKREWEKLPLRKKIKVKFLTFLKKSGIIKI